MSRFLIAIAALAFVLHLIFGSLVAFAAVAVVSAEAYIRYRARRTKQARDLLHFYCGEEGDDALASFLRIEQITHDIQDYLERYAYGSTLHGHIGPYRHVRDPNVLEALLRNIECADASVRRRCFMSQGKPIALYELTGLWRSWLRLYNHAGIDFPLSEGMRKKQVFAAS